MRWIFDQRLVGWIGAAILVAAVAVTLVPISVRHAAPLGVSRTIDSGRGIAVRGGYVAPNYDGFDRVALDIRVYGDEPFYDFTVHVRPSGPDQPDIRTIALRLPRAEVWHAKGAFANPYVTVDFPEIPDSAGSRFYVWVESGPRNRDDIWTLWRIKSYSSVPAWDVAKAWIASPPEPLGHWPGGVVLIALMAGAITTLAWLAVALARISPVPDRVPRA